MLRELRDRGITILMVEQNARSALAMSDFGIVLELGQTRLADRADAILADPRVGQLFLGGSIEAAREVLRGRMVERSMQAAECRRLEIQVEQRIIAQDVLSACRSALATKSAGAAEARAQLELASSGARPEEVQGAQAKVHRADADIAEIQAKLAQTILRSPIAGTSATPPASEPRIAPAVFQA